MYVFESMHHVSLFIALTVFVIFLAASGNPFVTAGRFVHQCFTDRKFAIHFLAVIAILFFNKYELWVEKDLNFHADFTPDIYKLEGNIVAVFQHWFENPLLTNFATFFYVVVFTALIAASLGLYAHPKSRPLFYAFCYAIIINYIIAIPFYLFFPVDEVWSYNPQVRFLIPDVFPSFEHSYRALSGINNCFPSLHTSISATVALLALRSGNRVWSGLALASCGIIIFSIFYLGIHWLTDTMGGLALALFAVKMGTLISGRQPASHALPQLLKTPNATK